MIRFLACILAVGAILTAGTSVLLSTSLAVFDVQELVLVQPADGGDDAYHCMCEVIGTCHVSMASNAGSSGGADPSCRQDASPFDDRRLAGIMPEVPSPPPRVT